MDSSMRFKTITTVISSTIAVMGILYYTRANINRLPAKVSDIRQKLPSTLKKWRNSGDEMPEDGEKVWQILDPVLSKHGLQQWNHLCMKCLEAPGNNVRLANGYTYVGPSRTEGHGVGTASALSLFEYYTPTQRSACTREGYDVVVRLVTINGEGQDHLKILRKVATEPACFLSNNHCLPMLDVLEFEDLTFAIFPLAGGSMLDVFNCWPRDSVGDILDMIAQALEGLTFLHSSNIAHRDAHISNFLVEWHPESLSTMNVPISKPRVHIIDFETSVIFPDDCPSQKKVCVGFPSEGWGRKLPAEVTSGKPYCPFKLDIWQFGMSFTGYYVYRTNIPAVDEMFVEWINDDPANRPTASEALSKFSDFINSTPPESLLVEGTVTEDVLYYAAPSK